MTEDILFTVSDFVAVFNQTVEYAFQGVQVTGELANFRVSKGKWVYFDLKDDYSSIKCFGTVFQLPGPLEDGMLLKVRAVPRLHQLYGFSLNISSIQPAGEGTIRRASELLLAKLNAEGLFDEARKRLLPYPPSRIGLVASGESAAYVDFIKVLNVRWSGIEIIHVDVQVQGEVAPRQIATAIEQLNGLAEPPEVLVITRGGGSAEDLHAFSTEQVTRAVAASRVPTLVAIGHEVDSSLAELAADKRASTPSNAAELLVPDRQHIQANLQETRLQLNREITDLVKDARLAIKQQLMELQRYTQNVFASEQQRLMSQKQLLEVLSPLAILRRGYTITKKGSTVLRGINDVAANDALTITFHDGKVSATVNKQESN